MVASEKPIADIKIHDGKEIRTPYTHPILNNPYDPPTAHWVMEQDSGLATGDLDKGRRKSSPLPTVPRAGGSPRQTTDAEIIMHKRINKIRDGVARWRKQDYPGISHEIASLLRYWRSDAVSGLRPFFCQVEAIESLVWICDVSDIVDNELSGLRNDLLGACREHNGDILRYATKMATGTGKTMVMGMIIAWQAMRQRSKTDIVIIVPNLTVKDRLSVLKPNAQDNVYEQIMPRGLSLPQDLRITIINYQSFRLRSTLTVGSSEAEASTKRLLTAGKKEAMSSWEENPVVMMDRVLASHRGASNIIVINDEAHHCYRPKKGAPEGESVKSQDAALWFSALENLQDLNRLDKVFDLSATPMFISGKTDELFPWIVSDYPLIDAIEAGLTKIPRVPVKDLTGNDEPKYRNIYNYVRKNDRNLRYDRMEKDVADLLRLLEAKYVETTTNYARTSKIPVMIVVSYPIHNAKALYKYLAGYMENGKWKEGSKMFSNVRNGKPLEKPVTLLVTSDMDDLDSRDWKDLAIEQETFFPKDSDKKAKAAHIREVFKTVGQKGKPGENIRCVVSVNMLTEGWDAKTVTHIFGYRPFKSDLLCEQVAGRALRRSSMENMDNGGLLSPEYAGIFGIPFSFMLGTGDNVIPGMESWEVCTEDNRENMRIIFPNLRSYRHERDSMTLELVSKKVREYKVEHSSGDPVVTETIGPVGKKDILDSPMREHTVIYEMAARIAEKFGDEGKRELFSSALKCVHEWLNHPNVKCDDPRLLASRPHNEAVAEEIRHACDSKKHPHGILPRFWDDRSHGLDTKIKSFLTTLKHRYPTDGIPAKSELNAAACHSREEVELAKKLDRNDNVEAWVRSHRLGWRIPYLDPGTGAWREYEPDFVARLRGGKTHLVIEYKGRETEDAQIKKCTTEEKWIPAVNGSDDPACAGTWRYLYIDNPARMGTELDEAIGKALESYSQEDT